MTKADLEKLDERDASFSKTERKHLSDKILADFKTLRSDLTAFGATSNRLFEEHGKKTDSQAENIVKLTSALKGAQATHKDLLNWVPSVYLSSRRGELELWLSNAERSLEHAKAVHARRVFYRVSPSTNKNEVAVRLYGTGGNDSSNPKKKEIITAYSSDNGKPKFDREKARRIVAAFGEIDLALGIVESCVQIASRKSDAIMTENEIYSLRNHPAKMSFDAAMRKIKESLESVATDFEELKTQVAGERAEFVID